MFAYGATGAGKTHTMLGSQGNPGVMYRTMKDLFKRMDDAKEEKEFAVTFSYLEVRDLMLIFFFTLYILHYTSLIPVSIWIEPVNSFHTLLKGSHFKSVFIYNPKCFNHCRRCCYFLLVTTLMDICKNSIEICISYSAFNMRLVPCVSLQLFWVCLQVYNEQIRDLLANAGPLAVREDSSKGVVVQGLSLHKVCINLFIEYIK